MKLSKLFIIVITGLAIMSNGYADEELNSLAVEYLELSKTEEMINETIDTYVNQLAAGNPGANKEQLKVFFESYMGWAVIKQPSIRIVGELLTKEELKAINDFYKTPNGASYANKSPALSAAISEVIGQNLNSAMKKLQQK